MEGSHTYDVIGRAIEGIHDEFDISAKVVATTTDSGSNLLKGFDRFGTPSIEVTGAFVEWSETMNDEVVDDDENFHFIELADILNTRYDEEFTGMEIYLPPHRKCTCHLLNLIAKSDVERFQDDKFQELRKCVEEKLVSIWNKQSRSSKMSDLIYKHLGKLFIIKNETRWSSLYNATFLVNYYLVQKKRIPRVIE